MCNPNSIRVQKALVCGWFSFPGASATAGDLLARDTVGEWLRAAGVPYDYLVTPPFSGGICLEELRPADYTDVIVVCGPYQEDWAPGNLLRRMPHARRHGVNLSMMQTVEQLNLPFHQLFERDSNRCARPDLSFLTSARRVPVAGRILVHPQPEYGDRGRHSDANAAIEQLLARQPAAIVPIDTQLDVNAGGLRSVSEVESLIARMDLVVTTRLHGTVLALKHRVPVIPVDPVAGGAKISAQVKAIGWPILFQGDDLNPQRLDEAFDYCLTPEAVQLAGECADRAGSVLRPIERQFIDGFLNPRLK